MNVSWAAHQLKMLELEREEEETRTLGALAALSAEQLEGRGSTIRCAVVQSYKERHGTAVLRLRPHREGGQLVFPPNRIRRGSIMGVCGLRDEDRARTGRHPLTGVVRSSTESELVLVVDDHRSRDMERFLAKGRLGLVRCDTLGSGETSDRLQGAVKSIQRGEWEQAEAVGAVLFGSVSAAKTESDVAEIREIVEWTPSFEWSRCGAGIRDESALPAPPTSTVGVPASSAASAASSAAAGAASSSVAHVDSPTPARAGEAATARASAAAIPSPSSEEEAVAAVDWRASLNERQKRAVTRCLASTELHVVHGPPGTGKTTTLVEALRQMVARGLRVLACAPSNVAVDNLAARIRALEPEMRMVRLGHPARVSDEVQPISLTAQVAADTEVQAAWKELERLEREGAKKSRGSSRHAQVGDDARGKAGKAHPSPHEEHKQRRAVRAVERDAAKRIIREARIVTATLSGAGSDVLWSSRDCRSFDVVVVDEAAQATEAACWVAARLAPRLILAGDHQQLPPTVLCEEASLLKYTMMERAIKRGGDAAVTLLTVQHRMNSAIGGWVSAASYDGALEAHPAVATRTVLDMEPVRRALDRPEPVDHLPWEEEGDEVQELDQEELKEWGSNGLVLVDTSGCADYEDDTDEANEARRALVKEIGRVGLEGATAEAAMAAVSESRSNAKEASLTVAVAASLVLRARLGPSTLVIITPYNGQVQLIRAALRALAAAVDSEAQSAALAAVRVSTVDGYQGQESDVVVLSLVRSNRKRAVGFLSDKRRLNVAVSRAKRLCVIVCDSGTAGSDSFVKSLLDCCSALSEGGDEAGGFSTEPGAVVRSADCYESATSFVASLVERFGSDEGESATPDRGVSRTSEKRPRRAARPSVAGAGKSGKEERRDDRKEMGGHHERDGRVETSKISKESGDDRDDQAGDTKGKSEGVDGEDDEPDEIAGEEATRAAPGAQEEAVDESPGARMETDDGVDGEDDEPDDIAGEEATRAAPGAQEEAVDESPGARMETDDSRKHSGRPADGPESVAGEPSLEIPVTLDEILARVPVVATAEELASLPPKSIRMICLAMKGKERLAAMRVHQRIVSEQRQSSGGFKALRHKVKEQEKLARQRARADAKRRQEDAPRAAAASSTAPRTLPATGDSTSPAALSRRPRRVPDGAAHALPTYEEARERVRARRRKRGVTTEGTESEEEEMAEEVARVLAASERGAFAVHGGAGHIVRGPVREGSLVDDGSVKEGDLRGWKREEVKRQIEERRGARTSGRKTSKKPSRKGRKGRK